MTPVSRQARIKLIAEGVVASYIRDISTRPAAAGLPRTLPPRIAGRRMDFEAASPDVIADAIAEEIGREVDYRPVDAGGAARAVALIAELL